jgi:hypothetical protein
MRKIIPDRTLIKMRYVSDIVLNPAAGSTASYVYSCNGMYDPDITSTGHQPMGFDQWMAFYQHYTVLGSKLSCSFASSNADLTTGAAIVGVAQRATSTAVSTNSSTLRERPNTRWRYLRPLYSGQRTTVTSRFSARKFFGKPKGGVLTEIDLKGNASSNPAEEAYWHIFAAGVQDTYDAGVISVNITLSFVAMLTEAKEFSAS